MLAGPFNAFYDVATSKKSIRLRSCDRCKEELYEYLNAAKAVREASSKTRFAVVHGTKQKELVEKLGIHRFPTIRLVVNGNFANAYEYKYVGQKHISVLNWLSKLAMPVRRVDDAEELKKATHGHNVPVGFFRDANSREAIIYQLVARDDADTNYCMVTNTTLIDELKIEGNARILFYRPVSRLSANNSLLCQVYFLAVFNSAFTPMFANF